MTKILVLNDTRDQPNWGSQACVQGLIDILEDRVPGARVETYTSAWMFRRYRRQARRLGGKIYYSAKPNRLQRRASMPYNLAPSVVDEFEFLAREWRAGRGGPGADRFVNDLRELDAVVFNAEGSTYRSNYMARLSLFMLWLARVHFDVPSFFLNGTVTLTDVDPILPGMARKALPVLDAITVRESRSVRNLARHVPEAEVRMVPDSVFAFSPDLTRTAAPAVRRLQEQLAGRPYFVLSSSMLPMDFRLTGRESSIVRLVEELKRVVPQAVLTGKDKGDQWMEKVADLTGSHFFGADNSFADLAALLQPASFLVSGRYHNIIIGSIVGCPAVPLTTTSPKIDGLCEIMDGVFGEPFDVTDLWSSIPAIVAKAEEHLAHREERREQLLRITARHRAATAEMGDVVHAALEGRRSAATADVRSSAG